MAFADPFDIVYNGATVHLPRVETGGKRTVYRSVDEIFTLTISHTEQGKQSQAVVRSVMRLERKVIAADPVSAENDYVTCVTQAVLERPKFGFTVTDIERQEATLAALLASTSIVDKLFGTES